LIYDQRARVRVKRIFLLDDKKLDSVSVYEYNNDETETIARELNYKYFDGDLESL
jgi:hypothetical protein